MTLRKKIEAHLERHVNSALIRYRNRYEFDKIVDAFKSEGFRIDNSSYDQNGRRVKALLNVKLLENPWEREDLLDKKFYILNAEDILDDLTVVSDELECEYNKLKIL